MIRGLLFDVDDTLVDHTTAVRTAIRAHLRAIWLDRCDDGVRPVPDGVVRLTSLADLEGVLT